MTTAGQAFKEVLIALRPLMVIVAAAVVWCGVRGIRAEIRERRAMRVLRRKAIGSRQ